MWRGPCPPPGRLQRRRGLGLVYVDSALERMGGGSGFLLGRTGLGGDEGLMAAVGGGRGVVRAAPHLREML